MKSLTEINVKPTSGKIPHIPIFISEQESMKIKLNKFQEYLQKLDSDICVILLVHWKKFLHNILQELII